jgi:hypothetical protein
MNERKEKIKEIAPEDLSLYKLMGTASGINLGHCVYLAQKYTPGFWDKVIGYAKKPIDEASPLSGTHICVSFYQHNPAEKS